MAVKYINDLEIDEKTINTIEYSLSTWKNKVENLCYIKGWA